MKPPNRTPVLSVSIHDCEVQHFRAGGNGGQHQNKTSSAARVIHHPSGARGEAREERSQLQNKRAAFERMVGTQKFKNWINLQLMERTPEEKVAEMMQPQNLKVEVKEDGKWVDECNPKHN